MWIFVQCISAHCEIQPFHTVKHQLPHIAIWAVWHKKPYQEQTEGWHHTSFCFLQCCLFLSNLTIIPHLHSCGMHSSCQQAFSNLTSAVIVLVPPCFSSSAGIWLGPVALLFFSTLIAFTISTSIITSIFIFRSPAHVNVPKSKVLEGSAG